jgi:hypothetical protein
VALRAKMRVVLEGATLADVSMGVLPPEVALLLEDEDVWRARI